MALAIKFQDMVDRGEVRDYADLARLGYGPRSRSAIRQIRFACSWWLGMVSSQNRIGADACSRFEYTVEYQPLNCGRVADAGGDEPFRASPTPAIVEQRDTVMFWYPKYKTGQASVDHRAGRWRRIFSGRPAHPPERAPSGIREVARMKIEYNPRKFLLLVPKPMLRQYFDARGILGDLAWNESTGANRLAA